jgi:hypothetical protein
MFAGLSSPRPGERFWDFPSADYLAISSEQGTAGHCKWCQKLEQSEMLTRTWLGS